MSSAKIKRPNSDIVDKPTLLYEFNYINYVVNAYQEMFRDKFIPSSYELFSLFCHNGSSDAQLLSLTARGAAVAPSTVAIFGGY